MIPGKGDKLWNVSPQATKDGDKLKYWEWYYLLQTNRKGFELLHLVPRPVYILSVYLTWLHVTRSYRPSPSIFAYCRQSKTGGGRGPGRAVVILMTNITSVDTDSWSHIQLGSNLLHFSAHLRTIFTSNLWLPIFTLPITNTNTVWPVRPISNSWSDYQSNPQCMQPATRLRISETSCQTLLECNTI